MQKLKGSVLAISDEAGTGCQYYEMAGDDICDDLANTEICAFDLGDCCSFENDRSLCNECICNVDLNKEENFLKESCQDYSDHACVHMHDCYILKLNRIGDGNCDSKFNTIEYSFDLGDCCIESTKCFKPEDPSDTSKY